MAAIRSGIKALFGSKAPLSEARPIDVGEFAKALGEVCGPLGKDGAQPRKFGLAISGGVDSMALAALCSRLQSASQSQEGEAPPLMEFQAFVVDHGVREGSNDEANSVARIMSEKGIQTQVLQIDWKGLRRPGDASNFESRARKQRYRILGKACRDLGIRSLLLAHHEDDQAETVLMRLINGHRKTGLTGMKSDAGFPECRGIYGVHESGDQAESALFYPNTFLGELPFPPQLLTEAGGLRLHRPMLSFSKSRLIATCQAENMEWFEDATNKDPTLTTRNAIRHIYNSHTMPAALSKPAILRLAERAKGESTKQQKIIDYYLSQCEVSDFQTRSGLVRIRFPTLDLPSTLSQEGKEAIGANIIRHIIMLVTPLENVPISGLSLTTRRIFPEIYPNDNIERTHRFSVANVDIRYGKDDTYLQKPKYLISRAPYHKNNFPFLPSPETSETQESPWSEWRLFDGRYWIRIKNKTTHPILIRPFLPTDSKLFDSNLSQASYMKLNQLSSIASAIMKWTLPCLVLQEGFLNGGQTKKEKVLAIPSFDVGIQDAEKFVEYEIKYKKIYWGALKNTTQEPQSRAAALDTTPPIIRVTAGKIKGDKEKNLVRYNDYVEPKGDEKEKPLIRKHGYGTKVLEVSEKPLIRYPKMAKESPLIQYRKTEKEKPLIRFHEAQTEIPLISHLKTKKPKKQKPLIRYHNAKKELVEEEEEKAPIRYYKLEKEKPIFRLAAAKKEKPLIQKHSYGTKGIEVREKPPEEKPLVRYTNVEKEKPLFPIVNGEMEEKPLFQNHVTDHLMDDKKEKPLVGIILTERELPAAQNVDTLSPQIEQPSFIPSIKEQSIKRVLSINEPSLIRRLEGRLIQKHYYGRTKANPVVKRVIREPEGDDGDETGEKKPLIRIIPVDRAVGKPGEPTVRRSPVNPFEERLLGKMEGAERSQTETPSDEKKPCKTEEEERSQAESLW